MLKKYIEPEMIIENWDTENILLESSVQLASLTDNIGGGSTFRDLGSVEYKNVLGIN